MNILEKIHCHSDLATLNADEREVLCSQIREFLIENVSKTGGHVASNLGAVELTVAIETVYDTASDRLVFDVGHQSYVHKMLTGRQSEFSTLRQFGGLAGFPKPSESITDAFVAGHASSSISIALGMARARTLQGEHYHVVAVIGDGSASGGLAYEGLNDAAVSNEPMVIILNDNEFSIDRNVGGMASHLMRLRTKERYLGMKRDTKIFLSKTRIGRRVSKWITSVKDRLRRMLIPETIFESMGFTYLGPVDGHNTEKLISLLQLAKSMKRPVIIHAITRKGKGYKPAEEHPDKFHGIGKFDPVTGEAVSVSASCFSNVFGETMLDIAARNDKLCAITAAMPGGTGLCEYKKQYAKRLFDVGIAEEHAVSMAGGLAKQGMIPVVALYSTFLQRAYDMILQDICMLNLHVVFAVDRAGLVGEDGETHHGVFDVGFLRHAPGLTFLAPASCAELKAMLCWAVEDQIGPVAIRYPRGGDGEFKADMWNPKEMVVTHCSGTDAAIITYGKLVNNALEAAKRLAAEGISISVIRLTSLSPISFDQLKNALSGVGNVILAEETGVGICKEIAYEIGAGHRISCVDLGNDYVTHGSIAQLYAQYGLDGESLANKVKEVLGK